MSTLADEDQKFFKEAAEAIVLVSKAKNLDPTIKELLMRIKYASDPTRVESYEDTIIQRGNINPKTMHSDSSSTISNANVRRDSFLEQNDDFRDDDDDDGTEKPFHCTQCTLKFRRSSDLRRHQRAHLPILPHICHLCGKGFARKDALKRHVDTLTCKRNREKLLGIGGDINLILERARQQG